MLSNVIHTIGTRGANAVLSVLIATLASRYLGAEVYGQVSLAMLCVSFFVLINSFVAGSPIVFFCIKSLNRSACADLFILDANYVGSVICCYCLGTKFFWFALLASSPKNMVAHSVCGFRKLHIWIFPELLSW